MAQLGFKTAAVARKKKSCRKTRNAAAGLNANGTKKNRCCLYGDFATLSPTIVSERPLMSFRSYLARGVRFNIVEHMCCCVAIVGELVVKAPYQLCLKGS